MESLQKVVYSKVEMRALRREMGELSYPEELLVHGEGKIVSIPPENKMDNNAKIRHKKDDLLKEKRGVTSARVKTSSAPENLSEETLSPTNWRKVKADFTEVGSKPSAKKHNKDKDLDSSGMTRYNNNRNKGDDYSSNHYQNSNRKQYQNKRRDDEDTWDMPTGLSSEESAGLSEREMFELERKKFLALRNQSKDAVTREGNFHTESDNIMDDMMAQQDRDPDVSQNSFSFHLNEPKTNSQSGIRSMTASDVMNANASARQLRSSSSEDMAWFGAALNGTNGDNSMNNTTSGVDNSNADESFFSHFLKDPVLTTPLTPPSSMSSVLSISTSDVNPLSLPHADNQKVAETTKDGVSSTKSSRLGSLLGISFSPPSSTSESVNISSATSGIKELSLSLDSAGDTVPSIDNNKSISSSSVHPSSSNKKSRDLLATLGFSPPRNVPATQFLPPPPQHAMHHPQSAGQPFVSPPMQNDNGIQVLNSAPIASGNFGTLQPSNGNGMQINLQQNNNVAPTLPVSSDKTPSKSSGMCVTPISSPAPLTTSKTVSSSGKKTSMSASSRLQLARMKQGSTKKKIDVSTLFNKAPASSSATASIKVSTTPPADTSNKAAGNVVKVTENSATTRSNHVTPPQSTIPPPASRNSPHVEASPKITTNTKGASLLMKLKK